MNILKGRIKSVRKRKIKTGIKPQVYFFGHMSDI